MQIKTEEYVCNYLFLDGKKIFIFLNGSIGVKEFFFDFKKYKNIDDGYLFIDFPGFGTSYFTGKTKKKITKIHIEALYKILLKENINDFILVLFSLSTVYLAEMVKIKYFIKNIEKIIFIDPSFFLSDLVWSKKINLMNKKLYLNYIYNYKKNISVIFHSFLFTKKRFEKVCNNLRMFDSEILYKFNKECFKIIKSQKLFNTFKKIDKLYILPFSKKNAKGISNLKNIFFLKKCGHYLFLDQPKKTYSIIKKYAKQYSRDSIT